MAEPHRMHCSLLTKKKKKKKTNKKYSRKLYLLFQILIHATENYMRRKLMLDKLTPGEQCCGKEKCINPKHLDF